MLKSSRKTSFSDPHTWDQNEAEIKMSIANELKFQQSCGREAACKLNLQITKLENQTNILLQKAKEKPNQKLKFASIAAQNKLKLNKLCF